MYTKIPMPQFEWRREDLRYVFCFFPMAGLIIALCLMLWMRFCIAFDVSTFFCTGVSCAVVVGLTGGIHADGFMDVADALSSHREREKKLQIMKDPHIGAFAVIIFAAYCGLFAGALCGISDWSACVTAALGFVYSRILSAICALAFPAARREGTLFLFADAAGEKALAILLCEAGVCALVMLFTSPLFGTAALAVGTFSILYYYFMTRRKFGGVTGDTAGYFLCVCECAMLMAVAVLEIFF